MIGFFGILFCLLLGLKLTGFIHISYFVLFLILFFPLILIGSIIGISGIFLCVFTLIKQRGINK